MAGDGAGFKCVLCPHQDANQNIKLNKKLKVP